METKTNAKMKAVKIYEYGNSGVFKYEDADMPKVEPEDVLVKVHYTSVNPFDWKVREGYVKQWIPLKLPAILGIDVAGTVEKIGSKVSGFKVGDKVISRADFITKGGSYAEYVAINEKNIAKAPKNIPMNEAAGIPVTGGTALIYLSDLIGLRKGQKLLVTGASGGVGTFAVQIAKSLGAYVIATTSKQNMELLKSLGADEVIDYKDGDFSKKVKNVDAVLDTVGGDTLAKSYTVLRKGGILATTAGQPDDELAKKYEITVKNKSVSADGKQLEELVKLVDSGKLKVILDSQFNLPQIKAASDLSQSGRAKGKIIIKVA